MSRNTRLVLIAAVAVTFCGLSASPAAAGTVTTKPETAFSFVSSPGDYIGGGATRSYTAPDTNVRVSGTAASVSVWVDAGDEWWSAELAAPRGDQLRPGVYLNAERAAFRTGRSPGLDVGGTGRGCNEVWGSFAVNQIATDAAGAITLFDATFTQHCGSATAPPLKGTVKLNALPLSYSFKSDPGDYIGGGASRSYANSTSTFGLTGSTSSLTYRVSGNRDNWSVRLAAPTGEALKVGTYTGAQRFAGPGHAGLDLGGNGRGCNQVTGSFTILQLGTDEQGNVTALSATLTQHCEGGTPALNATIHYFA